MPNNPFDPIIKNIGDTLNGVALQGMTPSISIMNFDGLDVASPADTQLLATNDPVINEIAVGMTGNYAEPGASYTVSGTPPLSLPASLGKPLESWSVEVSPYQEGAGNPSATNIRTIHGTDKLNLFVEESYDPSATPKAVVTLPQTVYKGRISDAGGDSESGMIVIDGVNVQGGIVNTTYISNTVTRAYVAVQNANIPSTPYPQNVTKCNCAIYNNGVVDNTQTYYVANSASRIEINVRLLNSLTGITTSDTVAEAKSKWNAYVAAHPIQVYYETVTPTQFSVTATSVPTLQGDISAWSTSEDGTVDSMEVTYVGEV